MPKVQASKFKGSAWHFPIFETGSKFNLLSRPADINWVENWKERYKGVLKFPLNFGWSKTEKAFNCNWYDEPFKLF